MLPSFSCEVIKDVKVILYSGCKGEKKNKEKEEKHKRKKKRKNKKKLDESKT